MIEKNNYMEATINSLYANRTKPIFANAMV